MIKRKCKLKDSVWQKWWAWRPIWVFEISDTKWCTITVWREWVWRCKKDSWGGSWWCYSISKPEGSDLAYPYDKVQEDEY